jgi:hypothetical protein
MFHFLVDFGFQTFLNFVTSFIFILITHSVVRRAGDRFGTGEVDARRQ